MDVEERKCGEKQAVYIWIITHTSSAFLKKNV
jgi:hypothetical protein